MLLPQGRHIGGKSGGVRNSGGGIKICTKNKKRENCQRRWWTQQRKQDSGRVAYAKTTPGNRVGDQQRGERSGGARPSLNFVSCCGFHYFHFFFLLRFPHPTRKRRSKEVRLIWRAAFPSPPAFFWLLAFSPTHRERRTGTLEE